MAFVGFHSPPHLALGFFSFFLIHLADGFFNKSSGPRCYFFFFFSGPCDSSVGNEAEKNPATSLSVDLNTELRTTLTGRKAFS